MAIDIQDNKTWEVIVKRIEDEKCILFVGPDIAISDNNKGINESLKEYLDNNSAQHNYY